MKTLGCLAIGLAALGCATVDDGVSERAGGIAGSGGSEAGGHGGNAAPSPEAAPMPTPPRAPTDAGAAATVADAARDFAGADVGAPAVQGDAAVAARSSGCGATAMPPNGPQTIVVNGKTRAYVVRPPKPYDPNHPYPVVFAFHGFQQSGAQMDANSGAPYNFRTVFGSTAIMVYPTALPNQGGDNSWARDIADDLDFFDAMLATFRSQMCVNPAMVLALGHSNGAVFANVVGCRRGNVVRGFAPVEGGLGTTSGCTAPPPAFLVHGDLDMLVSIGTGIKERDYWLKANGCSTQTPTPIDPAPCVRYQGCKPSPVVWCEHRETAYNGTGHGWPPWATQGMWTFFSGL
jgi:poly(3-hydroxybutyrate) depolymerase